MACRSMQRETALRTAAGRRVALPPTAMCGSGPWAAAAPALGAGQAMRAAAPSRSPATPNGWAVRARGRMVVATPAAHEVAGAPCSHSPPPPRRSVWAPAFDCDLPMCRLFLSRNIEAQRPRRRWGPMQPQRHAGGAAGPRCRAVECRPPVPVHAACRRVGGRCGGRSVRPAHRAPPPAMTHTACFALLRARGGSVHQHALCAAPTRAWVSEISRGTQSLA
eukprot:COSAG01_NODE_1780_length_9247_cov_8.464145_6_plen_221_part_00